MPVVAPSVLGKGSHEMGPVEEALEAELVEEAELVLEATEEVLDACALELELTLELELEIELEMELALELELIAAELAAELVVAEAPDEGEVELAELAEDDVTDALEELLLSPLSPPPQAERTALMISTMDKRGIE
jgi:hypothetical protein